MIQTIAWNVTLAAVGALILLFAWVAFGAGTRRPAEQVRPGAYRVRRVVFISLALAFFPITAVSLAHDPFGDPQPSPNATVIDVVGHQWYWTISQTRVPVGKLVLFRVTSADVNHGFAIYDDSLHVVAQTQAMPGYINGLPLVFDRAGRYRVMCLEYCGSLHHGMFAELEVVEENAS